MKQFTIARLREIKPNDAKKYTQHSIVDEVKKLSKWYPVGLCTSLDRERILYCNDEIINILKLKCEGYKTYTWYTCGTICVNGAAIRFLINKNSISVNIEAMMLYMMMFDRDVYGENKDSDFNKRIKTQRDLLRFSYYENEISSHKSRFYARHANHFDSERDETESESLS
jgi:hypothetical protein